VLGGRGRAEQVLHGEPHPGKTAGRPSTHTPMPRSGSSAHAAGGERVRLHGRLEVPATVRGGHAANRARRRLGTRGEDLDTPRPEGRCGSHSGLWSPSACHWSGPLENG
jgi:hypothetical protein